MSLPSWTPAGLLPPGRHAGSMLDAYDRMVIDGPALEKDIREEVFLGVRSVLAVVQRHIHHGVALIDGGIARRDMIVPIDASIVIVPGDWDAVTRLPDAAFSELELAMSLSDVIVGDGGYWSSVPAVSGLADCFLTSANELHVWLEEYSTAWDPARSSVVGNKGTVEVSW